MRIGLTGGIGCGKSTAGEFLEAAGFHRMDSDVIVRELLEGNQEVISAVQNRFGAQVLDESGGVNRSALATLVFSDTVALKWLETLLHPRVGAAWQSAMKTHPEKDWVVEIPLLFEKNLEKHFDSVVCVSATAVMQFKRLEAKGISKPHAKARMKRQMPLGEKVLKADFLLYNNGTLSFLKRQTQRLTAVLKTNPDTAAKPPY